MAAGTVSHAGITRAYPIKLGPEALAVAVRDHKWMGLGVPLLAMPIESASLRGHQPFIEF